MNRIERQHLRYALGNDCYRQSRMFAIAFEAVVVGLIVWACAYLYAIGI